MNSARKKGFSSKVSYRTSEEAARVSIDRMLSAVGWDDEQIELGGARYPEQKKDLQGKRPDYVLYSKEGRAPLAVVEAKKPNANLKSAVTQGIDYAKKLGCRVVFASDGNVVMSAWCPDGAPLIMDGQKVSDFLSPDKLARFNDSNVWDRGDAFQSSGDLINLFNSAKKQLNRQGIAKIAAFNEFANLIFVKILTELRDDGNTMFKDIPARWDDFANFTGAKLIEEYNKSLLDLNNHYGEGFEQTKVTLPDILERLVGLLAGRSFIGTDADVKGAAYEYFLRDYTKAKDELNRYFTPRHIVDMMVAKIDPKMGEVVYDPFCGTGGMLIQSFRHLQKRLPKKGDSQRARQLLRLQRKMLWGQDISETAHVAKMNMILAGDGHNNIRRCDSVIEKKFGMDIVITNIPFSSSGEREYVKVCLEAVRGCENGRIAIIVPERIVSEESYADFRCSILKEWYVDCLVSLPRDVFAEYTNAKTSVLFLSWKGDRTVQKEIQVFKIERDGMKGKSRRMPDLENPNDIDDMFSGELPPVTLKVSAPEFLFNTRQILTVTPRGNIGTMRFGDLVHPANRRVQIKPGMECVEPGSVAKEHKIVVRNRKRYSEVAPSGRKRWLIKKGDLVISMAHTQDGHIAYSDIDEDLHATRTHRAYLVREELVDKRYLLWAARKVLMSMKRDDIVKREGYSEEDILNILIPLPSLLSKQREIGRRMDAARRKISKSEEAVKKAREDFVDAEQNILPFDILCSESGDVQTKGGLLD